LILKRIAEKSKIIPFHTSSYGSVKIEKDDAHLICPASKDNEEEKQAFSMHEF